MFEINWTGRVGSSADIFGGEGDKVFLPLALLSLNIFERKTAQSENEVPPTETPLLGKCLFFSHLFWTSSSLDVPAGFTQEKDHTGFLIHFPSAVRAFIFLARRIQPFLSLVDREVEFCVLTISSFFTCWAFLVF